MRPSIVYSPEATVRLPTLRLVHSFDVHTYRRAFERLSVRFGLALEKLTFSSVAECSESDLLRVHDRQYLISLSSGAILAEAFGLFWVRLMPATLRQRCIIHPLLVAVQGTILAVELALRNGFAFHIGGGFHHAHRSKAEGSCLFADAVIAIRSAQAKGLLYPHESLLYIDLDAHRGNGVAELLKDEHGVYGLDIFNSDIYPGPPKQTLSNNWRVVPAASGCDNEAYLRMLECEFEGCLRTIQKPRLAIYNAGTDVLCGDPLGRLGLTGEGVLRRDRIVIDALVRAEIPLVILTSGGYTNSTPFLIAETAAYVLERYGALTSGKQESEDQEMSRIMHA